MNKKSFLVISIATVAIASNYTVCSEEKGSGWLGWARGLTQRQSGNENQRQELETLKKDKQDLQGQLEHEKERHLGLKCSVAFALGREVLPDENFQRRPYSVNRKMIANMPDDQLSSAAAELGTKQRIQRQNIFRAATGESYSPLFYSEYDANTHLEELAKARVLAVKLAKANEQLREKLAETQQLDGVFGVDTRNRHVRNHRHNRRGK